MRKYFVCLGVAVLMFASRSRADITVSDGSPDTFATAVADTITNGGGTILVTTPVVVTSADESFDGESKVVVSGGNTNSIFIVQSGSLALANLTLENGFATNGGAIYVTADGALTATNCIFSNNIAHGEDGVSAPTNTSSGGGTGANGGRGHAGTSGLGGAIFNAGSLSILDCQFFTNSAVGGNGGDGGAGQDGSVRGGNGGSGGNGASGRGAGIYNSGTLLLVDSTFSANLAHSGSGGAGGAGGGGLVPGVTARGGAAANAAGAGVYLTKTSPDAVILNCTFSGNTTQGGDSAAGGTSSGGNGLSGPSGGDALGGGVNNAGSLAVTNCTFFENNATGGTGGKGGDGAKGGDGGSGGNAIGGGLYNAGTVSVVNCTFSKGSAIGGTNGVAGSGPAAGRNGRQGGSSGGDIANVSKKRGSFFLMNSIIAHALSGRAGYGPIRDGGFNISADRSIAFKKGTKSRKSLNPQIGDLADNGGLTETIALATNSPAVDQLDPAIAPDTDQRGVPRPQIVFADLSDIGAFELDKDAVRIWAQPIKTTNVLVGSNVTFSVSATGTGPLFYQWLFNGALPDFANVVGGLTNSSLTITNVQLTNAGSFQVVVSNAFNSTTSHVAQLNVISVTNSTPTITQEPVSQTVAAGGTATFSVTAIGTAPLYYQWQFQVSSTLFTNIPGATSSTFSISNAQTANQGNYGAVITNNFGATNSMYVGLFVTNSTGGINPGQ